MCVVGPGAGAAAATLEVTTRTRRPDEAARASVPGTSTVPEKCDSGSAVKPSASSTVRPSGSSNE